MAKKKKKVAKRDITLVVPSIHYDFALEGLDYYMSECETQECRDNVARISLFSYDELPPNYAIKYYDNYDEYVANDGIHFFCENDFDIDDFFMSFENDEI